MVAALGYAHEADLNDELFSSAAWGVQALLALARLSEDCRKA